MDNPNLTKKQKNSLILTSWFIPNVKDWNSLGATKNDSIIGIVKVKEDPTGPSPEEAFFMRTDKGIVSSTVTNKAKLRALLWGQRWMATQEKMWRETEKGVIFPSDFDKEPEPVRLFVFKVFGWRYYEQS